MTAIDILILVILIVCLAWGYKKGIVVQLASLLSFAIAIAVCQIFGDAATSATLAILGHNPEPSADATLVEAAQSSMVTFAARVIGHAVLFAIVWIGIWLVARTVKFVAKRVCLGFFDSAAGALFMMLKAGVIMSLIVNFAKFAYPSSGLATNNGPIIGFIADLAPGLLGFIQNS